MEVDIDRNIEEVGKSEDYAVTDDREVENEDCAVSDGREVEEWRLCS
jgi:putative hemolysin